ncbi:MAG: serine hydrolase domain-containing protein [Terracoccus sp.]
MPTAIPVAVGAPTYAKALSVKIETALRRDAVPGAVVLVRSNEQGNWTAAFGTRQVGQNDPITPLDVFRLGDITETMTATAVLRLQDQGKLHLSDPISKYVDGVPNGSTITLQQLGDYSSGLFSYDQDASLRARYLADPQRTWTPQELLQVAFAHPAAPPSEDDAYTNTNYILLGLVIEKVTGTDAATAFRTLLLDPLNLARIGLSGASASLPGPHPRGYVFAPDTAGGETLTAAQRSAAVAGTLKPVDRTMESPSFAWTAGAAYGDASDLADFFQAMVDGPLLSAATRAERISRMEALGAADPGGVHYGYGIARYGTYLMYSGAVPGYHALVAYDPTMKNTIVVLTNLMWTPTGGAPVARIFAEVKAALGTSTTS